MKNKWALRVAALLVMLMLAGAGAGLAGAQKGGPQSDKPAVVQADTLQLVWVEIGSGASSPAGGDMTAGVTIGQPDTTVMSGGDLTVYGGFWGFTP